MDYNKPRGNTSTSVEKSINKNFVMSVLREKFDDVTINRDSDNTFQVYFKVAERNPDFIRNKFHILCRLYLTVTQTNWAGDLELSYNFYLAIGAASRDDYYGKSSTKNNCVHKFNQVLNNEIYFSIQSASNVGYKDSYDEYIFGFTMHERLTPGSERKIMTDIVSKIDLLFTGSNYNEMLDTMYYLGRFWPQNLKWTRD